jgi:hypothetical protein
MMGDEATTSTTASVVRATRQRSRRRAHAIQNSPWLSPKEAAEYLNVGVLRSTATGRIGTVRLDWVKTQTRFANQGEA